MSIFIWIDPQSLETMGVAVGVMGMPIPVSGFYHYR